MAKRDNLFLLIAAGLGVAAYVILKPQLPAVVGAPATSASGTAGGGVPGSPNQAVQNPPVVSTTNWIPGT